MPDGTPTRGAVFEPLVALAKAQAAALVEDGALVPDDGEFLLRALIDLECDGIDLFGRDDPADDDFYAAVGDYLAARVGRLALDVQLLDRAVTQIVSHQGGRT